MTNTIDKDKTKYHYSENRELRKIITNKEFKDREFLLFKLYYNEINDEKIKYFDNEIKKYSLIYFNYISTIVKAKTARLNRTYAIINRTNFSDIIGNYEEILKKIKNFAMELNIFNALELSIMYSYLLWNGYFSKTQENVFDFRDRKLIHGLQFADIIDGKGVCLNHSEMLNDFLNICGYNSAMLLNYYSDSVKMTKIIDIDRKFISGNETNNNMMRIFRYKKLNHVFNLIEDNKRLYIYDATNLSLFRVKDTTSSYIINGSGKIDLSPYDSYNFSITKGSCDVLDRLFTDKRFYLPYTKTDFKSISNVNIELLENNLSLLNDFYSDIFPNIEYISKETDKIVKKRTK